MSKLKTLKTAWDAKKVLNISSGKHNYSVIDVTDKALVASDPNMDRSKAGWQTVVDYPDSAALVGGSPGRPVEGKAFFDADWAHPVRFNLEQIEQLVEQGGFQKVTVAS